MRCRSHSASAQDGLYHFDHRHHCLHRHRSDHCPGRWEKWLWQEVQEAQPCRARQTQVQGRGPWLRQSSSKQGAARSADQGSALKIKQGQSSSKQGAACAAAQRSEQQRKWAVEAGTAAFMAMVRMENELKETEDLALHAIESYMSARTSSGLSSITRPKAPIHWQPRL